MSSSHGFGGDEIREESSWRYPLGIFVATLALCAIFLYHYVGPGVDELAGETPKPTISEERIMLTIGDKTFAVPANHTIYPKDRRDGVRKSLELYAMWPNMSGYSPARRSDFVDNEPDSRRILMSLGPKRSVFAEEERLEKIYLPHVVDKSGQVSDYQLTKFTFKKGHTNAPTNGYNNKDMFVGTTRDGQTIVLFCYKPSDDELIPSECWRAVDFSKKISVRYYFSRAYLPEWRKIDVTVRQFLTNLEK